MPTESSHQRTRKVFIVLACFSVLAAVYHLAAAAGIAALDTSSRTRHIVFLTINIVLAWYVLRRPLWMFPLYCCLVLQQSISHGGSAWILWRTQRSIDFVSVAALIVVYVGFLALFNDAKLRYTTLRRAPNAAAE